MVPGRQAPGTTPLSAPAAAGPVSPSGLPPRPDGDPDDPRSPLYDALSPVPVVSSPPPDLSGAVAFPSRPGASLAAALRILDLEDDLAAERALTACLHERLGEPDGPDG